MGGRYRKESEVVGKPRTSQSTSKLCVWFPISANEKSNKAIYGKAKKKTKKKKGGSHGQRFPKI